MSEVEEAKVVFKLKPIEIVMKNWFLRKEKRKENNKKEVV